MSSKDLTEALHALTVQAQGTDAGPPAMKTRGLAGKTRASALLAGASSAAGQTFTLGGELTIVSSDGLISIYFPETLKTDLGAKTQTLGVVVSE